MSPPHHGRVVQRGDRGARRAAAARVEELQPHDRNLPVDTRDAGAIVADGADRAGHVGAVRVVIEHIGGVGGEVPAIDVVDEAVCIVVDAVARRLAWVAPDVRGEVRMVVVDTGVDHGDDHRSRSGGDVPRRRGVDVGVGKPARLRRVIESPEPVEGGVVWNRRRGDDPVGLDVLDARGGARPTENIGRRRPGRDQREESLAERRRLPARADAHGTRRGVGSHDPRIGAGGDGLPVPSEPIHRERRADIGGHELTGFEPLRGERSGTAAACCTGGDSPSPTGRKNGVHGCLARRVVVGREILPEGREQIAYQS